MMNILHVACVAVVLVSMGSVPSVAAEVNTQDFTSAEQSLCQPDVFRLCNDAVPDDEQIATCMKAKRKQLSPECRKVFEAHMKKGAK